MFKQIVKLFGLFVVALLPDAIKKFVYTRWLGAKIHPSATIGLSIIQVRKLQMGPNSKIGHLNFFKNLEELVLGENSTIGSLNYVAAASIKNKEIFKNAPNRYPALKLGKNTKVVNRHFFDCNDTIEIGNFTTIAGRSSSFFTHGIDIKNNMQKTGKIYIGNYCMVSTNCVVLKDAVLPDYSILGAVSLLHKTQTQKHFLYSGVPAQPVKNLDETSLYFSRGTGHVS